jgi:hypothetical protein
VPFQLALKRVKAFFEGGWKGLGENSDTARLGKIRKSSHWKGLLKIPTRCFYFNVVETFDKYGMELFNELFYSCIPAQRQLSPLPKPLLMNVIHKKPQKDL